MSNLSITNLSVSGICGINGAVSLASTIVSSSSASFQGVTTSGLTAGGVINFTSNPISQNTPILPSHLIDKDYVDVANNSQNIAIVTSNNNITALQNKTQSLTGTLDLNISGITAFTTDLPLCSVVPTGANQLVNESYVDTGNNSQNIAIVNLQNKTASITGTIDLSISGVTTFSSALPLCTVAPSLANQLVNKSYVDILNNAQNVSIVNLQNKTASITGTTDLSISEVTTFSSALPLCSLTPSLGTQLVNKSYVDVGNNTQNIALVALQDKTVQIAYVTPVPVIGPMTNMTSSLSLLPYTSATILKAFTLSCNAVTCLGQIVAGGVGIVTSQIQVTNSGSIIKGLLIGSSTSIIGTNTVTFSSAFTGTIPKVLISIPNNSTFLTSRTLTTFTYTSSVGGNTIDWVAIQS